MTPLGIARRALQRIQQQREPRGHCHHLAHGQVVLEEPTGENRDTPNEDAFTATANQTQVFGHEKRSEKPVDQVEQVPPCMGDKKEKQIEGVQDCGESVGELWLTQPLIGIPERKGPLSEGSRRVDVEKIADVERSG